MSKKYREAAKEGSADISAKVPKNLVKKMDAEAKRQGKTRSGFIVAAIEAYVADLALTRKAAKSFLDERQKAAKAEA